MNAAQLVREADRVREMLRLTRDTLTAIPKTGKATQAIVLMASMEKRLLSQQRRFLGAALVELLWQYLDYVEGTDTGYVVRQVIADIGARN